MLYTIEDTTLVLSSIVSVSLQKIYGKQVDLVIHTTYVGGPEESVSYFSFRFSKDKAQAEHTRLLEALALIYSNLE